MTCLIVDDEIQSRNIIKDEILSLRKGYTIIGEANGVQTAIEAIHLLKPDIVLLDIELADGTGFDVIEAIDNRDIKIIFITAYNQYAVQAFRVAAIDYLLKPINSKDLNEALERALSIKDERLNIIKDTYKLTNQPNKRVAFASSDGYSLHYIKDIIRCESDNNYCFIFFCNHEKIMVSKTLKELEDLLTNHGFERVHQSHLINLACIKKYVIKNNGSLIMMDNSVIPVSQRKKARLLSIVHQYTV